MKRGDEREAERIKGLWHRQTASELTFFFFFFFSLLSLLSFPQTTQAFLPKMLELNHGHIVTVASSLGLFSTAGVEVSIIHNNTYTSRRSHHPKPVLFSEALGVPASTLGRGRLGPLSLVVPPPVKLRDTDEHWGASYRFLYLQQWGGRAPIGLWPQGQNELTAPQGTETSSSLLCEQLGAHSVFSSQPLSMDKVFPSYSFFFFPLSQYRFFFCCLMHIKIFSGIIYLHNHSRSKLVAYLTVLF